MAQKATNIRKLEEWLLNDHTDCFISTKIEIRDTIYGGRGVVAREAIKSQTPIIKISHSYLLNFTSIVAHITYFNTDIKLPAAYKHIHVPVTELEDDIITNFYSKLTLEELLELTSFQIVTMYLVMEHIRAEDSWWYPFIELLPTIDDFKTSPFIWKVLKQDGYEALLDKLPTSTLTHTNSMYEKFETDYNKVSELLNKYNIVQKLTLNLFLLYWMCVNSRCLYIEIPESKSTEGNFTMAPYVDFINHSSVDQCTLKIDRSGFYVKTPIGMNYKDDDELFLSYGPHSNEFLLCEYGFMLNENQWNDIDITNEIIKLLTSQQIEYLREKDYFGDYTLTSDNISFRTEIALAVAQESSDLYFNRKLDGYLNGITDGSVYKPVSNRLLKRILLKLKDDSSQYENLSDNPDFRLQTIGKLHKDRLQIIEKRLEALDI